MTESSPAERRNECPREGNKRDTVAAASSKQALQSMYVLEKGTGDAAASSSKEALLQQEGRKERREGGMS
jgi:NAD(P)H-hydrate repair Nnr-like enzyme with NAD(P)H-hydrate dehydratase domain